MTDVPIDKSNLPRVNEVCRDFAVLEDGALAHCLQEQEIEQHYASNIRKNKLVQKDIRIAKKLQDEEDLQCKVFSLEKQKQIEEQDSEYARAIQEELQRKALECLQREEEDKEIAKRLQQLEEEELQKKKQDWSRGEHGDLQQQPQYVNPLANEEEEEFLFRSDSKKSISTPDYRRTQWSSEREHSLKHSEEQVVRMNSAHKASVNRMSFGQIHYESNSKNGKTDVWKEPSRRELVQVPYRNPRNSLETSPSSPICSEVKLGHDRELSRKEEKIRVPREKHCKHYSEKCRRSSSDSDDCTDQCVRDKRSRHSQWHQSRDHRPHRSLNNPPSRIPSHILRSDEEPKPSFDIDPLDWKMAELHVRNSDQLIQDEELARQLQEEEEKRLAKLKHRENPEDFRAAQVAQDEEIAKYIQQQELKAHRRSDDLELRESDDDGSICSFSERRNLGIKNEVPSSNQGRLDSEGLATPTECRTPERMDHSTAEGTMEQARLRSPRNIAEELDPTFKSKKEPSNEVFAVYSQEFPVPSQTQALPVDGFYELMDDGAEPIFIPPTKRQSEKLGRSKPKDKKEGCKQQ
ncbi:Hypothetical predicted protein [Pelobates cultripes]|uniref:Coiled-coil domain-containing protein n=1 Tax=Pelobates cultripes TaxID=61616 RepID=A0AAD1T943_PELCU|nr:Hypothetical predicted protein [Pelobates cultripes]